MSKRHHVKPINLFNLPIVRSRVFAGPRHDEPTATDIAEAVGRLGTSFDSFKAAHNSKLETIEASLADQDKELRRMYISIEAGRTAGLGQHDGYMSAADREARKALGQYFRTGQFHASLSTQSNPDGGYLVTPQIDSAIGEVARSVSPIRQYANVVQGANWSKIVNINGETSGWVTETGSRPQTQGMQLSKITLTPGELYCMPAVTQVLLDDASFDIVGLIQKMVGRRFGLDEGAAFVSGDGINKPRGFMSYNFVDNASWAWNSVGYVASGDASAFPAATSTVSPADCLFDLIYSLNPEYRANAAFFMNDTTLATVSKFKTASTGELIWRPSLVAGQPSSLLGYPVISTPDMPDIGANKFPIVFADMKEFYTISDAAPTSILVDPYSTKPYVLYYARKRVAGAVTNFAAAKALKIASAS